MLTRFVRNQLIIFTIASIVGVAAMVFTYMQAPTLLGIGRMTVTLELPAAGGLYQFTNVTYRGVQVGKVTDVKLTENGAEATLSLDTSPKIPADLQAEVRSVSAVGEQYVDLRPRTDSGPYLQDGSVIAMDNTTIPQAVGPMLDQVSALVDSIPKDKLSQLLDESFQAFNGAGYDFGSLIDSAAKLAGDANGVSDQTRTLIDDSGPLLDSQAETTDSIRTWARSLAGVTEQVAANDPDSSCDPAARPGLRGRGLGAAERCQADAAGVAGQPDHARADRGHLQPVARAAAGAAAGVHCGTTGIRLAEEQPDRAAVGRLRPHHRRSAAVHGRVPAAVAVADPDDTTTIDTPDGLYCKLPQDSPIAVRGARNYPCMGHPGKRAPTVEICNSDKPFVPLAMRQHALGPYPFDPNLVAAGHSARRPGRLQRPHLRARGGHAAAAGCSSGGHATGSTAGYEVGAATTGFLGMGHRRVRRHPCRSRPRCRPRHRCPRRRRATRSTGCRYRQPRRRRSRMVVQSLPPQVRSAPTQLADRRSRSPTTTRTGATSPHRARWSSRRT